MNHNPVVSEEMRLDVVANRIKRFLAPLPLLDEDEGLMTRITLNEQSKARVIAGIVAEKMAGWTPTQWGPEQPLK